MRPGKVIRTLNSAVDRTDRLPCGLPHSCLSMADQPSSTAKKSKKKGRRNLIKPFLDLITPKSANASASPSNSNRVFVSSAHEPVSGNDAGSADLKVSSTYIGLVLSTTTQRLSRRQCYLESGYVLS